jgi:hypothetical protein
VVTTYNYQYFNIKILRILSTRFTDVLHRSSQAILIAYLKSTYRLVLAMRLLSGRDGMILNVSKALHNTRQSHNRENANKCF